MSGKKKTKKATKKKASRPTSANKSGDEGEGELGVGDLLEKVETLTKQCQLANEERNYFQLERDKISSFWEITKKELTDEKAKCRNKDRAQEAAEEQHAVEIKTLKHNLKHVHLGHQDNISKLKEKAEEQSIKNQREARLSHNELKKQIQSLKLELKESELQNQDLIQNMKLEHDKTISRMRAEFEQQAQELNQKSEEKLRTLRESAELQRKAEISEVEERKNAHIQRLMTNHETAFHEIQHYYNEITRNSTEHIKNLKEEIKEVRLKEGNSSKDLFDVKQRNLLLSEPLEKAQKEAAELRKELAAYEKDKNSLKLAKATNKQLQAQIKQIEWEKEVLEQKFEKLQVERDELYDKLVAAVYDVRQKAGFKNILLEKKVQALEDVFEKKDAQLSEVLSAANLDPSAIGAVTKKLDDVLAAKNDAIRELHYELDRVTKAHNDVIRVYEAKLAEFGIPSEELGFKPLHTKTASGPAGLVA